MSQRGGQAAKAAVWTAGGGRPHWLAAARIQWARRTVKYTSRVLFVLRVRVAYGSLITYMLGGKHSRSGYRSPRQDQAGSAQSGFCHEGVPFFMPCLAHIHGCWALGANGSSTCHVEKLP
jgi:hypothetical protein